MLPEILLKVAAKTAVPKLAGAIIKNKQEGKRVLCRAYGVQALYQLTKSVALSNDMLDGQETVLVLITTSVIDQSQQESIREFTYEIIFRSDVLA